VLLDGADCPSVLQVRFSAGMITMENWLKALCDRGLITEADALEHVFDTREMARPLRRPYR